MAASAVGRLGGVPRAVVRGGDAALRHDRAVGGGGIGRLSVAHRIPIALRRLTNNTIETGARTRRRQARHKGDDAAVAAIEMANLARQIA